MNNGDSAVGDGKIEKSMKQEGKSNWERTAADCWSQQGAPGFSCSSDQNHLTLAAVQVGQDKGNWMEGRVVERRRELATANGLDPDKATMDDVIKARAERGSKENEGRVERLRVLEARKYNLDPEKADWSQIEIARVEARKAELERKYGSK